MALLRGQRDDACVDRERVDKIVHDKASSEGKMGFAVSSSNPTLATSQTPEVAPGEYPVKVITA